MEEPAYLLRSPANAAWLAEGMAEVRRGEATERPLDPFAGVGKPERLRHHLAGAWSRRITDEHRPVYAVSKDKDDQDVVTIIACHYRYDR